MKLSELSVLERSQLNDLNPNMCRFVVMEKQGKSVPAMFVAGGSSSLETLRKLDLFELERVEESIRLCLEGDKSTDDNEALAYYRKSFELNPWNDIAVKSYGCVLAASGKLAEGIEWIRKALEINPNSTRARDDLMAMEDDLRREQR